MKFTINTTVLQKILQDIKLDLASTYNHSIVKIEAKKTSDGSQLILQAIKYETKMQITSCENSCEVIEEGRAFMEYHKIANIISKLQKDVNITLQFKKSETHHYTETSLLLVEYKGTTVSAEYIDFLEYRHADERKRQYVKDVISITQDEAEHKEEFISIFSVELRKILKQVVSFNSSEATGFSHEHIKLYTENKDGQNYLVAVSTCGSVVAFSRTPVSDTSLVHSISFYRKHAKVAIKLLNNKKGMCQFKTNAKPDKYTLIIGNLTIQGETDYNSFDWKKALPTEISCQVEVKKQELMDAESILAIQGLRFLEFRIKPTEIEIGAFATIHPSPNTTVTNRSDIQSSVKIPCKSTASEERVMYMLLSTLEKFTSQADCGDDITIKLGVLGERVCIITDSLDDKDKFYLVALRYSN